MRRWRGHRCAGWRIACHRRARIHRREAAEAACNHRQEAAEAAGVAGSHHRAEAAEAEAAGSHHLAEAAEAEVSILLRAAGAAAVANPTYSVLLSLFEAAEDPRLHRQTVRSSEKD